MAVLRNLWAAASGMQAGQTAVDVIANNLANVNTPGFKKSRVAFSELLVQEVMPTPEAAVAASARLRSVVGAAAPAAGAGTLEGAGAIRVGTGVGVAAVERLFLQGGIEFTGLPTDLALEGAGFFTLREAGGGLGFTRDGSFRVDAQGYLVTSGGVRVLGGSAANPQPIRLPEGWVELTVSRSGQVSARMADGALRDAGALLVAVFPNPGGLEALGDNVYAPTEAAGQPSLGPGGSGGRAQVIQGGREQANVELAEELVNLVLAQRAYELGARAVQVADQMLALANSVRRS